MPRENRVDDLRNDGVVVADDAGKERLLGAQLGDEIFAHFVFDAASANIAAVDGRFELSECGWSGLGPHAAIMTP